MKRVGQQTYSSSTWLAERAAEEARKTTSLATSIRRVEKFAAEARLSDGFRANIEAVVAAAKREGRNDDRFRADVDDDR